MSAAVAAAVGAPIGAVVGFGAGRLSLLLERLEGLEEEDREDREAYQQQVIAAQTAAAVAGEEPPTADPWPATRFGPTWLENVLSPLLGAVGFAAFAAHQPLDRGLVIRLLWVTIFVQIVGFDLKHRLILNRVTYPALVVAVALAPVSPGLTLPRALAGAAAVGVFFFVQNLVSRGSIGLGDAKLGALVGAVCGLGLTHLGALYAVLYAVILGGATAALLLITRLRSLKDPIPYGPFLCAGAGVILFLGP